MPMPNTLEQELFKYFLKLDNAEQKSILQLIKTFAKGKETASEHINIEQYNKEIDEAIARIEAGEFYTHEDVVKMAKDW